MNGWTPAVADVRARAVSDVTYAPNGSGRFALHEAGSDKTSLHVVQAISPAVDSVARVAGFLLRRRLVVSRAFEPHCEGLAVEDRPLGELVGALPRRIHGSGIHEVFAIRPQADGLRGRKL